MRWHRRLTTTQQMEIQASHYTKCEMCIRDSLLGSYSIPITVAGIPSLLFLLKSMILYLSLIHI